MKKLLLLISFVSFSYFTALAQKQSDSVYVSHNGMVFKVGQKVTLGLGSGTDGRYKYIVRIDIVGLPESDKCLSSEYATRQVTIKKIKYQKTTFFSKEVTVYLVFKPEDQQLQGYGINIEPALLAKEVQAN
jgi:hypothetical protein